LVHSIRRFGKEKARQTTGLRKDDPNDTIKAKILRAELEAKEFRGAPVVNGAAWDSCQQAGIKPS
jgi:hypothetical protein